MAANAEFCTLISNNIVPMPHLSQFEKPASVTGRESVAVNMHERERERKRVEGGGRENDRELCERLTPLPDLFCGKRISLGLCL